jgi:hypothetical protein
LSSEPARRHAIEPPVRDLAETATAAEDGQDSAGLLVALALAAPLVLIELAWIGVLVLLVGRVRDLL